MRYSYEFKRKCVEMYREGKPLEIPEGISTRAFRDTVRKWVRIEEPCGQEALQHKASKKYGQQKKNLN